MAENGSMEGKDYAQYERETRIFEQMIVQAINSREEGQEELVLQKGFIQMQVKKEKGVYKLRLLGEDIATINEKGKFSYNVRGLKNIREMIEDQGVANYNDLGLPDIEYLEYLEREKERQDGDEKSNSNKTNEGKDEEEQQDGEEEERGEEEKGDVEKPKINTKGPNWIKLDLGRKVTENDTLRDLIPNSEKYQEIYIVPGKDHHSYTIQGGDKDNGYELIEGLEQTEGSNPTQKMISIQSKGQMEVESKQALVMFKIRGREDQGFSISKVQSGNEQVRMEYWRKAYSDMYISTTVPQSTADRGVDMPSPEVRYLMSKNYTSRLEMEKIFEAHEDLEELKKQDIPDEIDPTADGIELEELSREAFKQKMYEDVLKQLQDEKGDQIPGFLERKAKEIVNGVVDEGKDYKEAKDDAFAGRDEGKGEAGEEEYRTME